MGALFRDNNGDVLMTTNLRETVLQNLETTEYLAIFRGLQLCLNLGINHLIVELDCQTLVKELQSDDASSMDGNIILDLKVLMTYFHMCYVSFAYSQNNVAVHKLARFIFNVDNIAF